MRSRIMSSYYSNRSRETGLTVPALLKEYFKTVELFGEEEFYDSSQSSIDRSPKILATVDAPSLISSSDSLKGNKEKKLFALYKKFENCQNCPLGRTRTKIVFGIGSVNPQVLFIGEGPGYDEDKNGIPFVGKAGMLLDKILKAISLDRNGVYITNIVKCHPMKDPDHPEMRGNDRPPLPLEIESCRAILDQQIEILDPPLICTLGTTAAKTLLRSESGISHLRGKIYKFQFPVTEKVVSLVPTYHPAALLRNESLKKDVWQDMKLVKKLIESKER